MYEARGRIAELESKLAAEREARGIDTNRLLCALAAERERREAAENLLLSYESQDFRAIAKHFARYEKLCASSSRALAD